MASDVLSRLKVIIGADNKQFLSGIQQSQRQLTGFTKGVQAFSRIAATAFAGISVGRLAADLFTTGQQVKGVQLAFNSLNQPGLLNKLREATSGTVSDLELMKQSVRAENFQIPVEKLATAFEFAQKRAAATGESVDYLTTSIIDGIGRKSSLVLDNLGISASQLQEEMKRTGNFAEAAFNLIEQGAKDADKAVGDFVNRQQQLATIFENIKNNVSTVFSQSLVDGAFKYYEIVRGIADEFERITGIDKTSLSINRPAPFQSAGGPGLGGIDLGLNNVSTGLFSPTQVLLNRISQDAIDPKKVSFFDLFEITTPSLVDTNAGVSSALDGIREQFGLGNRLTIAPSEAEINAFALNQNVAEEVAATFDNVEEKVVNLNGLTNTLTSSFTGLFNTILQGGASADDIFKSFVSTLAGGLLNYATGGIFGAIFGGGGGGGFASAGPAITQNITGGQIQTVISQDSTRKRRALGGI